jgi:Holliday junction resolvase RusA-like endonuclease
MSLPFDESSVSEAAQPDTVSFTVYGQPTAKGSARAFVVRKKGETGAGHAVIVPDNQKNLRAWEQSIRQAAQRYAGGFFLGEGTPVEIEFWFYFTRPKSKKRGTPMVVKPDFDKLARAVADAITAVLFKDDAQVTDAGIHKRYLDEGYQGPPHVKVVVRRSRHAT